MPTETASLRTVDVSELQQNLSAILDSDNPVTITRDGQRIGQYIPDRRSQYMPAPRKPVDWEAFEERARLVEEDLAAAGLTEDEVVADFIAQRRKRNEEVARNR